MSSAELSPTEIPTPTAKPKRGLINRLFRLSCWLVLVFVVAAVSVRPFLPRLVKWEVNRVLDKSKLYRGKIDDVDLHLWRGAYVIRGIRLVKTTGDVPVPLFSCKAMDLSVEWPALLKRKVVGRVRFQEPEVNFVDSPDPATAEDGSGGPWLEILNGLFPFDINSVNVDNASVHFRTYQKQIPVDVYLSQLNASVENLTNVDQSITPLLTTVKADGTAMDQAKFEMRMKVNPFSYKPSFTVGLRLIGLDITKVNDLAVAYGGFDVKHGLFDLVVDITADEGNLSGYVKPLFRGMKIFDPVQDIQSDNVLRVFWQAIVGGTSAIVTNYNRDQLGTIIPVSGVLQGPEIDFLSTFANLLRNAFIRAFLPRLEKQQQSVDGLQFGPGSLTDPDMSSTDN